MTYKKKSIKIIALIFMLFSIFGIPYIINESYKSGKGYITLWEAKEVLGFYGSVLGGIITFLGVYITLEFTRRENLEEKHNSVMPFIKVWHLNGADPKEIVEKNPSYDYVYDPDDATFHKKVGFNRNSFFVRDLVFKNIGRGIASKINMYIIHLDNNGNSGNIIKVKDSLNLGVNEVEIYGFMIKSYFATEGDYQLILEYEDVFQRSYIQTISFKLVKDAVYTINLGDFLTVSAPIKIN